MDKDIVEKLTDAEFIAMCQEFETLNERDRVQFIDSRFYSPDGLFNPITRIIKGRVYSFGNNTQDRHAAERIGNIYLNLIKYRWSENQVRSIDERISNADDLIIKIGVIEAEIDAIIANDDQYYQKGYRAEKRGVKAFEFIPSCFHFENVPITFDVIGIICLLASGAAGRLTENYLNRLLPEIKAKYYESIRSSIPFGRGGGNSVELEEENKEELPKWSALTYILHEYFKGGCKPLESNFINSIKPDGVTIKRISNLHAEVIRENEYNHTGETKSVKTFRTAYNHLLRHFKDTNAKAYETVKFRLEQLNKNYP